MKINSKIQRIILATLMVFATAALGLQPLVFSSQSGLASQCNCRANVEVDGSAATCCNDSVEIQIERCCCVSKPVAPKKCCCNPEAAVCKCIDCRCGENKTPDQPIPAIPVNETNEVFASPLTCAVTFVEYPQESQIKRVVLPNDAYEFAALTSQQTCILLSRFTC